MEHINKNLRHFEWALQPVIHPQPTVALAMDWQKSIPNYLETNRDKLCETPCFNIWNISNHTCLMRSLLSHPAGRAPTVPLAPAQKNIFKIQSTAVTAILRPRVYASHPSHTAHLWPLSSLKHSKFQSPVSFWKSSYPKSLQPLRSALCWAEQGASSFSKEARKLMPFLSRHQSRPKRARVAEAGLSPCAPKALTMRLSVCLTFRHSLTGAEERLLFALTLRTGSRLRKQMGAPWEASANKTRLPEISPVIFKTPLRVLPHPLKTCKKQAGNFKSRSSHDTELIQGWAD